MMRFDRTRFHDFLSFFSFSLSLPLSLSPSLFLSLPFFLCPLSHNLSLSLSLPLPLTHTRTHMHTHVHEFISISPSLRRLIIHILPTWGTMAGKVHSSMGCVCPSVIVVMSENLKAYNLKEVKGDRPGRT